MHLKHCARHASPNGGFTLTELLTVIAIIGILAVLLFPTVGLVKQKARYATCQSNLRQLYTGVQLFTQDNKGLLPAVYHKDPWYTVLNRDYINEPKVFFCPSSVNEPELKANFVSYGYNFNLSAGVGAPPSVNINSLLYPGSLILIADSIDTGNQQYYIHRTGDNLRVGTRHREQVHLVHVDGSIALTAPEELLNDKFWRPLR